MARAEVGKGAKRRLNWLNVQAVVRHEACSSRAVRRSLGALMARKPESTKTGARFCRRCGYKFSLSGDGECPMCARLEQTRRDFVVPRPGELTNYRGEGSGDVGDEAAEYHPEKSALEGEPSSTLWVDKPRPAVARETGAHGSNIMVQIASLRHATLRDRERATQGIPSTPTGEYAARIGPDLSKWWKRRPRWKFSSPLMNWREQMTTLVSVAVVATAGLVGAVVALLLN